MNSTPFTCLGCGCACDDTSAEIQGGTVRAVENVCDLGRSWLQDAQLPNRVVSRGSETDLAHALDAAAALLAAAQGRALVWLGPGLSVQALRGAVAVADYVQASVDTATSLVAAQSILAGQRRGRAAATLGELKNRADLVVYWNVSPSDRYPRFEQRFVVARDAKRVVLRVGVGTAAAGGSGPADWVINPAHEVATLALLRAIVVGQAQPRAEQYQPAVTFANRLMQAKYVVIVVDGEGDDVGPTQSAMRSEALIALVQALNGPTRAALIVLRAGDNRNGVESLLTWQTGFPFSVDFAAGRPAFAPERRGLAELATGRFSAALICGDWRALPASARRSLIPRGVVAIGPRASESTVGAEIMIDTGIAGLHEGGTAYRMDDVPLPLSPLIDGPRSAAGTLEGLAECVAQRFRV